MREDGDEHDDAECEPAPRSPHARAYRGFLGPCQASHVVPHDEKLRTGCYRRSVSTSVVLRCWSSASGFSGASLPRKPWSKMPCSAVMMMPASRLGVTLARKTP